MKKHSIRQSPQRRKKAGAGPSTIGMDLGDKSSRYAVLDEHGHLQREDSVATTTPALTRVFGKMRPCRIAIEAGGHSPWVSRLLAQCGHEVIVANPRQVRLISQSSRKDDRIDAQTLARLARVDPELLHPIQHRGEQAQADLMLIRVRDSLVEARTALVNAARGLAKSMGQRLPACATGYWDEEFLREAEITPLLRETLGPLARQIASLTVEIERSDKHIEEVARSKYPEIEAMLQVNGVGILTALTFALTLDDKWRFRKSRDVGCFVGLRPKRKSSGERQPELHISKEGDAYLRKLLVQCAHCILSHRGQDSDLRRWGLQLAARGGKNQKKRALVAVARKLGILLHHLWATGEVYEPFYKSRAAERAA